MNELLEKLGTTLDQLQGFIIGNAQEVWQVCVKQVWIDCVICIIVGIIGLIISYYLYCLTIKKWDDWDEEIIFPIIGSIISFIVGMVFFLDGIRTILNPEYFVIKELLTLIK